MTVQITGFYPNKAALQSALNQNAATVFFYDPSIVNERTFDGLDIAKGTKIVVVLDPKTRRRFAEVARQMDGTFKVR